MANSENKSFPTRIKDKAIDGTTWVSKRTFLPFAGIWGASVVFPGVIPAAIATGAGVGAATDAGALLYDKTRNKDAGGSLPKKGNIFTRGIKGVAGGAWAVPRDTFRQVKPTKSALGY